MDAKEEIVTRIVNAAAENTELNDFKNRCIVILSDYDVGRKNNAIIPYDAGQNENLIRAFALAKAVAGCTKRTVDYYTTALNRCLMEMGKSVPDVNSIDIQCLLAKVMQRSSKTNANNYRRVLSSFYGWLQREEIITRNPMNKVEAIKERKKKKAALTELDVEMIRGACRTGRETAMVDVMMSTGCRVSELVNIRLSDIDGDAVVVLGKGEKYRTVYLNARALMSVKNYLAERKDGNPYLFPRMADECRDSENMKHTSKIRENWYKVPEMVDDTRCADKGTVESICRKLGKRAGIEGVHPHRFRRTCATMALRRGMPIEQVSKMLGHEQIATTQIYLDLTEDELAQAHRKFVV